MRGVRGNDSKNGGAGESLGSGFNVGGIHIWYFLVERRSGVDLLGFGQDFGGNITNSGRGVASFTDALISVVAFCARALFGGWGAYGLIWGVDVRNGMARGDRKQNK